MKRLFTALLLLAYLPLANADCGCEDHVFMRVTYQDKITHKIVTKWVIGRWWAIHYSARPYSQDPGENSKMAALPAEVLLAKRLLEGYSYKVVNRYKTVTIKTKLNGLVSFPFIVEQDEKLTSMNAGKIIKVEQMRVGCAAWPKSVVPQIVKFLTDKTPYIKQERPDSEGVGYTEYELRYYLRSDELNVHFSYGYDGGCA